MTACGCFEALGFTRFRVSGLGFGVFGFRNLQPKKPGMIRQIPSSSRPRGSWYGSTKASTRTTSMTARSHASLPEEAIFEALTEGLEFRV